ncbi:MAG TPA: amidohydrolase family protein [Tepidisphaeraceae bacterium]|jgi:beta-aspartyl-dipeptidase (metallo-type)
MLTLIERGELYGPAPVAGSSVLCAGEKILRIGNIDGAALARAGLECERIDASECVIVPGLIDPHAHLIGAGGEQGFASRMTEMPWTDFIRAGVTTVVGCLGTDVVGRNLATLLAKARELEARSINTFMYTGGFPVPAPTLTGSIQSDMVLIDKVIGVGEVAIADVRSSQPTLDELARLVSSAYVGGTISGKCGVTHFHVGPAEQRLGLLHELLNQRQHYEISPRHLYPTHVTRSRELMDDAIALARRGAYVDTDTVEDDVSKWLPYYLENDGPAERFTFSSDAHTPGGSVAKLYRTLVQCVREHGVPLERALPMFTANTADALMMPQAGRLREGARADLLVLQKKSLELRDVVSRGTVLMRDREIPTSRNTQDNASLS